MDVVLGLIQNILEEGLIYGIMAMGVFITYKILDFPDLSVDGTLPLGACVTAVLIAAGVDPWLSCLVAFVCGAAAGSLTGLLHVKFGITDLLSGILVMTGLWSVNLILLGGSAVLPFYNLPTIFTSFPFSLLPESLQPYRVVIAALALAVLVKLLLDWFLKTRAGLLLRATGDNAQFVTLLAQSPGARKVLGLAIGNGCTALAGSVLAQQAQSANINMGKSMVVMALAAVIIGSSVFGRISFLKATTMAVLGSLLYKACLALAIQLGLPANYLKLLMAALLTAALIANRLTERKGGKGRG